MAPELITSYLGGSLAHPNLQVFLADSQSVQFFRRGNTKASKVVIRWHAVIDGFSNDDRCLLPIFLTPFCIIFCLGFAHFLLLNGGQHHRGGRGTLTTPRTLFRGLNSVEFIASS